MAETKLKLVKSDFNLSAAKTLSSVFEDSNFSDVTLVSEDHNHIQAHRVILSAGSQFFKDILEKNPHPHPVVCLRLKHSIMESVVRFLYLGECEMPQRDIETFLTTARWLMVEGLIPGEQLNETSFMSPWQAEDRAEINIEEDMLKKETNTNMSNIAGVIEDSVNLEENVVLNYLEYKEESSVEGVATVKKKRGPDKEWFEKEIFASKTYFDKSELRKDLDDAMTKKSSYDTAREKLEFYVCKYTKRKAYQPCPVFIRVTYYQDNLKIVVFTNEEKQCHELNPNYDTPTNFHFT